jgi:hypothetical protein
VLLLLLLLLLVLPCCLFALPTLTLSLLLSWLARNTTSAVAQEGE